MFSIVKSYSTEIMTAILMLLILNAGISIAKINFKVQMKSYHVNLKQQELMDENASYTRLLVKYINQKGIYQGTLNQDQQERAEFEYDQNSINEEGMDETIQLSPIEKPVILLVNGIRKFTGNPPIAITDGKNHDTMLLYQAYNYENSRSYSNAIAIYNSFRRDDSKSDFKANVMLHSGYCHALMEDYDTARAEYKQIIADYKDSSIAVAAALLLRYMDMFNSERQSILDSSDNNLVKGEKLAVLLNHKAALEVLEDYTPRNKEEKSRLEYTKGVSYEELGDKKKAVDSFVKSVEADNNSQAAKYANRRIYSIATELPDNKEIIDSSIKIGILQKDSVLQEIDKIYQDKKNASNEQRENKLKTDEMIAAMQSIESNIAKENIKIQNKPTEPAVTKEKFYSQLIGKKIEVTTISNETFTGVLKTSEKADFIIIQTLIGSVGIEKKNVKSIAPFNK